MQDDRPEPFQAPISRLVWETKYRAKEDGVADATVRDTWRRVARALAWVEPKDRDAWGSRFHGVLEGFRFLPAGRILAGAGTRRRVTLLNCFVMGTIEDSTDGIFEALKEGALTMQQGGGVGYDFSTLRPRGSRALRAGAIASGPVSFMRIWDAMCETMLSTGARRGAMMGTLRCDHPDIEEFVRAKRKVGELRNFNMSVLVSDAFMEAVRRDAEWELVFPSYAKGEGDDRDGPVVMRAWSGSRVPVPCRIHRRIRARELWQTIMRSTYEHAEPGVLFIDRINRRNNLHYIEQISATNPCGEIPLPPYGACDLGSLNLTSFVLEAFTEEARIDWEALRETAEIATRMLDNVLDATRYPLQSQADRVRAARRIGLGLTGLADALVMLGLHYGSHEGRELAAAVMRLVSHTAYRTSIDIAKEKGSFPELIVERFLEGEFIRSLPDDIQSGIRAHGIRNSHLVAIAPSGTISLLANNVSSGLEPIFNLRFKRRILLADGTVSEEEVSDFAHASWVERFGSRPVPKAFVTARELSPNAHLDMQAALQPFVDNAISKTINVPKEMPFDAFRGLYELAYDKGLKGCTTFRENPITGEVLAPAAASDVVSPCCDVGRETD